jgi:hypothetical protein
MTRRQLRYPAREDGRLAFRSGLPGLCSEHFSDSSTCLFRGRTSRIEMVGNAFQLRAACRALFTCSQEQFYYPARHEAP